MTNLCLRYLGLVSILTLSSLVSAQIPRERKYDPDRSVRQALEDVARKKYGPGYKVSYHIMDSLIAHSPISQIKDSYGTLRGHVLFSAWRDEDERDSIISGFYRNGQIVWDNYPGTRAGFGGGLFLSDDINDDGEVDILRSEPDLELMYREGPGITYLWILSWNGTRGKIINDIDKRTGQSMLVSTDHVYEFLDNKGTPSIRGEIEEIWQKYFPMLRPSTLPRISYTWNGTKYGYWSKAKKAN